MKVSKGFGDFTLGDWLGFMLLFAFDIVGLWYFYNYVPGPDGMSWKQFFGAILIVGGFGLFMSSFGVIVLGIMIGSRRSGK